MPVGYGGGSAIHANPMDKEQPSIPFALVVEDDGHIAQVLRFMRERQAYRVIHSADGRAIGISAVEGDPTWCAALTTRRTKHRASVRD